MIYTVIAVASNGDEWVISTFDKASDATVAAEEYKKNDSRFEYRVDTSEIKRGQVDKSLLKLVLNSLYGKNLTQPVYTTDSMREYTKEDLFGVDVSDIAPEWFVCIECGACVRHTKTHVEWHNKLLP